MRIVFSLILTVFLFGCTTTAVINRGQVEQIALIEKDFEVVEIIFLTSTATVDSNGLIIDGSPVTFEMLMREAQRVGADDIANLRIDEIFTRTSVAEIAERRTVTFKATALAIRYINTREY